MNTNVKTHRFVLLTVTVVTLAFLAACSETSLQSLLEGEEGGGFELTTREVHLETSDEYTLSARGGFKPYFFDLDNGVGEIDTSSGRFRSPESLNDELLIEVPVSAMDNAGATDTAKVLLYERLSASPRTLEVPADENFEANPITVWGGFGSYTFDLETEDGETATGVTGSAEFDEDPDDEDRMILRYTSPENPGTIFLSIRDELANRVTVEITVHPDDELRVIPSSKTVVLNGVPAPLEFQVIGGTGAADDYEVIVEPEGVGSVSEIEANATFTFEFTPSGEGTATITVTDDAGAGTEVDATVHVVTDEPDALRLSPSSVTVAPGSSADFSASGGVPPYDFRVRPGGGVNLEEIDDSTARVTMREDLPPGQANGSWEVIVTDSRSERVSSTLHQDTD